MKPEFLNFKSFKKFSESGEKILLVCSEAKAKSKNAFDHLPPSLAARIEKALSRRVEPIKASESLSIPGVEKTDSDLFLAILPEAPTSFDLLGFANTSLKNSLMGADEKFILVILESKGEVALADGFGAALAGRIFKMPVYGKRAEKLKPFKLKNFVLVSASNVVKKFQYGFETGEGANLVRMLGALPPNELNTGTYGDRIREIAKQYKFKVKFYSNLELKKMGAGAFTAVDRGDPDSKGGIYEISHMPSKSKNKKPLVFVGKGLCFDTGGYDIKTQSYMIGMKADMTGSALALSSMMTISRLGWPLQMKAFLGVTENHISPKAYKADEVVIALNGTSIEVINTDAEGRMVLADVLCLASQTKPELIIDFATLTGSAVMAVGTSYAAGFSNRDDLHSKIIKAGKISGERVWPFPMDKDYDKALESPIADTIQCIKARGPDHILAALFLSKFVEKEIPWVHIDLAAAEKTGGLAHIDSLQTGYGVRWTLEFIKSVLRF